MNKQPSQTRRSSMWLVSALVLSVLIVAYFLAPVSSWFSADSVRLDLVADDGVPDRLALPPTEGLIELTFDPPASVTEVVGATEQEDRRFVADSCLAGCTVRFRLDADQGDATVEIAYIEGDSEYLNDIIVE